jgi:protein-disulfide isomerase
MSLSLHRFALLGMTGLLTVGLSAAQAQAPTPMGPPPPAPVADAGKSVTVNIPLTALDDEIKTYLLAHPEVISQAMQAAQAKQQQAQQVDAQKNITAEADRIYNDPSSPVVGNPNGTETVVEFFDFTCHYCRQMFPDLKADIASDPNLKVIYKELPILGPNGVYAAKVALAANKQGKYEALHNALFAHEGALDNATVLQIAGTIPGMDMDKLKADMDSPDVAKEIADVSQLAQTLNIHGTPSLIINGQFYGGALPPDQLKAHIAEHKNG